MENTEAQNLVDKGIEAYNRGKFKGAIKYFNNAAQFTMEDDDVCLDRGFFFPQKKLLQENVIIFEELLGTYKRVEGIKPDDAGAFYDWGLALYFLAIIKNEKTLFREASEQFKKTAEINPDYASVYTKWGNALFRLGMDGYNKELYMEAFEKFEKATLIHPDDYNAFDCWGYALYWFALNEEKILFLRESIKKTEKAGQINPDYADVFLDIGMKLYYFAKSTEDESLLGEIGENFKKAKKNVLNILTPFRNEDKEYIIEKNLLYPFLDAETSDSQFFKEITKDIDKNKLDDYKKAYLLSACIISVLYVNNPHEEFIAHYREKTISYEMLFNDSKFRLNAINYSNDISEGETLLDYLYQSRESATKKTLHTGYMAFAGCFSFNYDSLTQFRLYGRKDGMEGTGLSLVFRKSFFSGKPKMPTEQSLIVDNIFKKKEGKHALFRCIYIDPETERVDTVGQKDRYLFYRERNEGKFKEHNENINEIINIVNKKMGELKRLTKDLEQEVIGQLLINLRYLTKHIAFKDEQECRIVEIHSLKDEKIKISDNFEQMYVEYEPNVTNHIEKIYFGPKASGMKLFQDILTHKKLMISCEQSKNPLE